MPTLVSPDAVATVARALTTLPAGFTPHEKVAELIERRAGMAGGAKPVDWGMGEALAFGKLVGDGMRVRLSGQDVRRGTFSHRHAVFIDYLTGEEYTPLEHVSPGQGTFEVRDSPLSEAGVLGFEYGYSLDMPEGLVIWEAQFGDFVNAAQVIIDQFLVSSEAKWRRALGKGHTYTDYPILVAGRAGGRLKYPGVHYRSDTEENTSKVLLTVARAAGLRLREFGAGGGHVTNSVTAIET